MVTMLVLPLCPACQDTGCLPGHRIGSALEDARGEIHVAVAAQGYAHGTCMPAERIVFLVPLIDHEVKR